MVSQRGANLVFGFRVHHRRGKGFKGVFFAWLEVGARQKGVNPRCDNIYVSAVVRFPVQRTRNNTHKNWWKFEKKKIIIIRLTVAQFVYIYAVGEKKLFPGHEFPPRQRFYLPLLMFLWFCRPITSLYLFSLLKNNNNNNTYCPLAHYSPFIYQRPTRAKP